MQKKNKYFGTDGIRGQFGTPPITPSFMEKLGYAIGKVLLLEKNNLKPKVIIGCDTRASAGEIEAALIKGLKKVGVLYHVVGIMPTAGIAYLTKFERMHMGIVISASHNPYTDNGIKIFSSDGVKISAETEQLIESFIDYPEAEFKNSKTKNDTTKPGFFNHSITANSENNINNSVNLTNPQQSYIDFCKKSVGNKTNFNSMKIVLDCANGATSFIATEIFSQLGADVINLDAEPNGFNINVNCGSNHPQNIQQHVLQHKADVGIAFDGDGDRVIMVDHHGEVLDGDDLLYIIVHGLIHTKQFNGGVVGTVMSNKGLELALKFLNIDFTRTPVGDHHVIEKLNQQSWLVGGEPSGHIIYAAYTTTADGIIAALQVLSTMASTKKNLHELKRGMRKFPQHLVNVPCHKTGMDLTAPPIVKALQTVEARLGKTGRVLLRPSGTEPVIRIMAEAEDLALVKEQVQELASVISKSIKP